MNKSSYKKTNTLSVLLSLFLLVTCAHATPSLQLCDNMTQMHAPTIIEGNPGELLLTFYAGTKVLNPDNKEVTDCNIWISRLSQDENSWSAPVVIASSQEIKAGTPVPCLDPVLCKTSTGKIHLFYKVGTSTENWTGYVKSSDDNGTTWSTPRCLAPYGVTGPHRCKPVELENGSLVFAATRGSWNFRASCSERTNANLTQWEVSNLICRENSHEIIQQPAIFRTGDTINMLFRVRGLKNIYTSRSTNFGETWENATPVYELAGSDSSLDVIQLHDEAETPLLAYNDIEGSKRYRLVLMKPENNNFNFVCTNWKQIKVIAESDNQDDVFCYPSMIQDSNGLVHLVYVKNYQEICYEIFDEEELI
jgi:predicted neuraminidase